MSLNSDLYSDSLINYGNGYFNGIVTSSSKYIGFFIPIGKYINPSATKCVLTSSGSVTIRSSKGYVTGFSFSDNVKFQDIKSHFPSITIVLSINKQNNSILVDMSNGNEFGNIENNIPVIVSIDGLQISFS